jgi:hypothetical protein
MVTVILGEPPRWFEDGPQYAVIDRDPNEVDFGPLVEMPVHVIDLRGDDDLTLRAMAAMEGVKVKALGVCGPAGTCGLNVEHERAMERFRELLCATTN